MLQDQTLEQVRDLVESVEVVAERAVEEVVVGEEEAAEEVTYYSNLASVH